MKSGIASRGSPIVSSIGRSWPGGIPARSFRSCVKGEEIAPDVREESGWVISGQSMLRLEPLSHAKGPNGKQRDDAHDLTFARLRDAGRSEYPAKLMREVRLIVKTCRMRGGREIAALHDLRNRGAHPAPTPHTGDRKRRSPA